MIDQAPPTFQELVYRAELRHALTSVEPRTVAGLLVRLALKRAGDTNSTRIEYKHAAAFSDGREKGVDCTLAVSLGEGTASLNIKVSRLDAPGSPYRVQCNSFDRTLQSRGEFEVLAAVILRQLATSVRLPWENM